MFKKYISCFLSILASTLLLVTLSSSYGTLPALGKLLNSGSGVWVNARENLTSTKNQDISSEILNDEVSVLFDKSDIPQIVANNDEDGWKTIGYLHANNRLFQMDLMRRQGKGLLSEIMGEPTLEVDKFQRQLGIARTAEAEWVILKKNKEIKKVLEAYSAGVNEAIEEKVIKNDLPLYFKLLGYTPSKWSPKDTLVVKMMLNQMMSLSTTSVKQEFLKEHLGEKLYSQISPVNPVIKYRPYDTGSYKKNKLEKMSMSAESLFNSPNGTLENANSSVKTELNNIKYTKSSYQDGLKQLLVGFSHLPTFSIDNNMNSNGWVVDGSKTSTGKPMMANDPHLGLTLPSTWYQLQVKTPTSNISGVTVPGIPFILVGFNENISWGLTNGQNLQTFYYKETTDKEHDNQYYWKGKWHSFNTRTEQIPVKNKKKVRFEIKSSVHGPIVNEAGYKLSMNWIGSVPSTSIEALYKINKASNLNEFSNALKTWKTPIMNFLYSDKNGNIAIFGAGSYPVFKENSKPWFAMTGNGDSDIIGSIPFESTPKSINPKSHVLVTANQRQVNNKYPYFIGTTNDFEPGYRANRIYSLLSEKEKLTIEDFKKIQGDFEDNMARGLLPELIKNLQDKKLNKTERKAFSIIKSWNYQMDSNSQGATLWWTFLEEYINETFRPLWKKYGIYNSKNASTIMDLFSIYPKIQALTLEDPGNFIFDNMLSGKKREAEDVILISFKKSIKKIEREMGNNTENWKWGNIHKRSIPSLIQLRALSYGPIPFGGNLFTPNASGSEMVSSHGPSWRMIIDWGSNSKVGVYPGGQSENPLSKFYDDGIKLWINNKYRDIKDINKSESGITLWKIRPD
ncbi:penicillin acylase family protein [Bacillus atrophaeus]|uniref:penicillin acylase family protein n=3 Tax=Bacillus atrophaeus TaxID=1452 RepID=UPI00227FD06C|nr:penicillin acylase family protein [Bacillus atrophaeus]MCY8814961.1 penicillin acylase family protein [Bacillus atrophaeus]MCY8823175.1 penicillin acylase family protein [Bacillus atrophaeus]MCY8831026.1 penicillin acylase family protein [Bacillus atrophaeus]MCY8834834.1 penicillin acylase family protein [Bacillus atrophaeus]MEC0752063.1 penicillin acylase family protein [Bacillus atrophaeus]